MNIKRLIPGLVLALILAACGGQTPATTPPANTTPASPGAYPSPGAAQTSAYPTPPTAAPVVEGAYPIIGTEAVLPEGPAFTITTPVKAASGEVCGTGPANVPVRLVNINQNAAVLGRAVIGTDGTYCIKADSPLPQGDVIGLMLGDLAGTEFKPEQFIRSTTYTDMPQIGIIFAMTTIE